MSDDKRIIAESIMENFASISPHVVKQSLADMVVENEQLQRAIADVCDAWEAKSAQEFHAWFGEHVARAKAEAAKIGRRT